MRKRAIKISVRLNEQEHEHLKKQARLSGYPMEPFIRALIMGITLKPRPPDEYRELLRELSAIGNNANQLAHQANARGEATQGEIEEAVRLIQEAWQLVKDAL